MEALKWQYERFPYPNYSLFAFPRKIDTYSLNYRASVYACFGSTAFSRAVPRILVVGCGTFEPLAVALANQDAQITAIDISAKSLQTLRQRLTLFFMNKRVNLINQDVLQARKEELGEFDYIICTGVLHHIAQRKEAMRAMLELLAPLGVMRFMVYSRYVRERVYEIQQFAKILQCKTAEELQGKIDLLPPEHPLRVQFYLYQDTQNKSGIVDGFLHAYDEAFDAESIVALSKNFDLHLEWQLQTKLEDSIIEVEKKIGLRVSTSNKNKQMAALEKLNEWETNLKFYLCRQQDKNYSKTVSVKINEIEPNPVIKKVLSSRSPLLNKWFPLQLKTSDGNEQVSDQVVDLLTTRMEKEQALKILPQTRLQRLLKNHILLEAGRFDN